RVGRRKSPRAVPAVGTRLPRSDTARARRTRRFAMTLKANNGGGNAEQRQRAVVPDRPKETSRRLAGKLARPSVLGVVLPIATVFAVHGTNVRYRLFYDDYGWLGYSDHHGWFKDLITPGRGAAIYRPVLGLWFTGMSAVF